MNRLNIDEMVRRAQAPVPPLPDRFATGVLREVRRRETRSAARRDHGTGWGWMPGWRLGPAVALATLAMAAVIGLQSPEWWPSGDADLSRQALALDILSARGSDVPSVLLGRFP